MWSEADPARSRGPAESPARDAWLDVGVRHLAALAAVSREHSFARAAQRLGYVQSAVSQQIAALERATGMRLIDRSPGPGAVELTAAGRLVLSRVQDILDQLDGAGRELTALALRESRTLRVSVAGGVPSVALAALLARFRALHPTVRLEVLEPAADGELLRSLAGGESDVALGELPAPSPLVAAEALAEHPRVVLARADSALVRRAGGVGLAELCAQPLILARAACGPDALERRLRATGSEPHVIHRSDDLRSVRAWVSAGLGIAIVAAHEAPAGDARIALVELCEPLPARVTGLLWWRERPPRAPAVWLADVARAVWTAG